jgi:hypothetical protein
MMILSGWDVFVEDDELFCWNVVGVVDEIIEEYLRRDNIYICLQHTSFHCIAQVPR